MNAVYCRINLYLIAYNLKGKIIKQYIFVNGYITTLFMIYLFTPRSRFLSQADEDGKQNNGDSNEDLMIMWCHLSAKCVR